MITSSKKLPDGVKQMMELMKKGYMNSQFNFKADGKFTVEFQEGVPEFMRELKFLNNKDWKFIESEQLISIGTKQDNYNHMRMYVKNQGGKILFAFNDTPLILEMTKNKSRRILQGR